MVATSRFAFSIMFPLFVLVVTVLIVTTSTAAAATTTTAGSGTGTVAFLVVPQQQQRRSCTSSVSTSTTTSTQLAFGIPSFLTPSNDNNNEKNKKVATTTATTGSSKNKNPKIAKNEEATPPPKQVGAMGLIQLIMAGAGAPFLGDFDKVEEGTGKLLFTLEANNLVDENGNSKQTMAPYFENGWVDPIDLQREEERKRNKKKGWF